MIFIERDRIGKYRVLRVLGRGGCSVVYLAEDVVLEKRWAIKAIPRSASPQLREAQVMKCLDHPGLPRITEQIDDDEYCYLVMDYCEGVTLDARCRKTPATELEVIRWGIWLCEILEYLHGQNPPVIYRDMKPGNVILGKNGRLKLVDFGIAGSPHDEKKDSCGTRGFAAPEQYEGKAGISSDLYNLGATLQWTLQNRKCRSLEGVLKRCTRDNPGKRFADSRSVKQALLEVKRKHRKKRGLRNVLALCVTLLLVVGLGQTVTDVIWDGAYTKALGEKDYEQAIRLYPERTAPYVGLLRQYESKGSTAEGIVLLEAYMEQYEEEIEDPEQIYMEAGMLCLRGSVWDETFPADYHRAEAWFQNMGDNGYVRLFQGISEELQKFSGDIDRERMRAYLGELESELKGKAALPYIREKMMLAGLYLSGASCLGEPVAETLMRGKALLEELDGLLQHMALKDLRQIYQGEVSMMQGEVCRRIGLLKKEEAVSVASDEQPAHAPEMTGRTPGEAYFKEGIEAYEKALAYTEEPWKQERIRSDIAYLRECIELGE